MPKTGIKKDQLRDFVSYHKWIYVLLALCVYLCADVLYNATKYKVPNERQVYFQVVSPSVNLEGRLMELESETLEQVQQIDPTLEEVLFHRIAYDPDNDVDGYGGQQYMLMLGVAEGDIYIVPEDPMHVLVNEGFLLPLEGYIEQGILDPGNVDLESVTFAESPELDDYDPNAKHVYAIPMVNMNRMLQPDINVDNRKMYMVLMSFSANPETCAHAMDYVIEQLTAEEPAWVMPLATPLPEGQNAFDSALQEAGFATAAPTELPAE